MGLCSFNRVRDDRRRQQQIKRRRAAAAADLMEKESKKAQQKQDSKKELPDKSVGPSFSKERKLKKLNRKEV